MSTHLRRAAAAVAARAAAADSVLRLPEVVALTGRCRSSIYADIAAGTFPPPLRLGPRSVGWRQSDIDAWLNSREVGTLAPPAAASAASRARRATPTPAPTPAPPARRTARTARVPAAGAPGGAA